MKPTGDRRTLRNIVIFRTDRIGEVLLTTPIIEALKRHIPDSRISYVTSDYARDAVSGRADITEVIGFSTIDRSFSLSGAVSLSSQLRRRRFDLAIIVNPHKMLHLACFLAGIPRRVGFDRKWAGLLTDRIPDRREQGAMHEVEYNLSLLEAIGIKEKNIAPVMHIASEDSRSVQKIFEDHKIDQGKKIVVVHPGSSNPAKRWSLEYFIAVIEALADKGGINIIVTGDTNENQICQKIASACGSPVINLCGLLRIGQLAAVLKKADLMITNDNGPMHIAAAVGTKVIALFGRNIPGVGLRRWGPYGEGHVVFHKDPGCSPCYDRDCPYQFKCLAQIRPNEVIEKARDILNR